VSAPKLAREVAGAVLRDVAIDPRPIVLGRASQAAARAAQRGEPGRAPRQGAPAVPAAGSSGASAGPASSPAYDEGFRAGVASAEAAQRTIAQASVDATQRAAFERGREEGKALGFAEGREAGRQKAEQEVRAARDAAAARIAQLDELLEKVRSELARRLEQAEEDMVTLCHAAICRILGEELVTREGVAQHVRQAIREGGFLGAGSTLGQLAIHVHPQDLAGLEGDPVLASWLRQHAAAGVVRWVPDERVRMGGCLVRSGEGTIDARLETQLAALQRVLSEERPANQAAASGAGPSTSAGGEGGG
jgi:flagellar assembly protein FliH